MTEPANYRAPRHFDQWLKARGIIGFSGLDTRALTARIREHGMPNGVIAHNAKGKFDVAKLKKIACRLARSGGHGFGQGCFTDPAPSLGRETVGLGGRDIRAPKAGGYKVIAVDYGLKRNILRCLTSPGCDVTVVPATTSAEDILEMKPDGIFLSNGPGDPAATGEYAVPEFGKLVQIGQAPLRHLPRSPDARPWRSVR